MKSDTAAEIIENLSRLGCRSVHIGGGEPFLVSLMTEGIGGLFTAASDTYGYEAGPSYVSTCELCYDIRRFLVAEKGVDSPDLQPVQYYMQE